MIESTQADLALSGQPGDLALVFFALDVGPAFYAPSFGLAAHLIEPIGGLVPLPVSPTGNLDLTFALPPLSAGKESFQFVGQTAFYDGVCFFDGGPTTLVIVSAGL